MSATSRGALLEHGVAERGGSSYGGHLARLPTSRGLQTRSGSTSMRRRPGGRGVGGRASHSASWSAARTSHAPVGRARTSTRVSAAGLRRTARPAVAGHEREGRERRERQGRGGERARPHRDRPGSACSAAAITSWSGRRVCTTTRPLAAAADDARRARASSASACSPARNRGASSSWSKSRNTTTSAAVDAVQHRLGADEHARSSGTLVGRRPSPRRPARPTSACQLLARARHADAQRLEPRRPQCAHSGGRVRAAAAAAEAVVALLRRPPRSARTRASSPHAAHASSRRPALAVEDAQHPPVRRARGSTRRGGQRPGARILAAQVDDLDGRPSPRAPRPRRAQSSRLARPSCSSDGHGDTSTQRHARPARPLGHDLPRVPGRRPLLLVAPRRARRARRRRGIGRGRPRRRRAHRRR